MRDAEARLPPTVPADQETAGTVLLGQNPVLLHSNLCRTQSQSGARWMKRAIVNEALPFQARMGKALFTEEPGPQFPHGMSGPVGPRVQAKATGLGQVSIQSAEWLSDPRERSSSGDTGAV